MLLIEFFTGFVAEMYNSISDNESDSISKSSISSSSIGRGRRWVKII